MDNTNELFKLIRERLKYPIISVYAIILIIYNWDVLSILFFSDLPIEGRVIYIKHSYPDYGFERIWIPLLKAFIAMIVSAIVMLTIDSIVYFPNQGRIWLKHKIEETKKGNDVTIANLLYNKNQALEGNKTLEEMRRIISEKDQSIEDLHKSYGQRIGVMEETTKQLQTTIDQQKKDYELQGKELNLERSNSTENAGDLINALNFIEIFIQPTLNKFQINAENILLVLSKIVNKNNISSEELRREIGHQIAMNDIKYLDFINDLKTRGLVMVSNEAKNLSITVKGHALWASLGPIVHDVFGSKTTQLRAQHRVGVAGSHSNFREPSSMQENGSHIEGGDTLESDPAT